jgi:hypothetical protein
VFVLLAIGQISISSTNSYQSSDYLSSMSTNINDFGTRGFAVNGVSIFISQVILSFCFAIVVFGEKRNIVDKITWWVSILCIIYFAFNLVGIGARMYMMFPLLALFVRFMLQKRSALSRIVHTTIIALLAIVGLWMAVVIQNYRQVKNIEFDDFIESRNAVSFNNVLEVLTEKFNSVDNGVILIEYYGFGFAPFRPFYGAILSPIPRIVYPDKPVPGSYNNDYTGTPTRMVAYLLGYGEDSGTVGVSQSAITLWQLGWPGFGIFVIFNVLNIMLVNGFLNAKSIFIKAIGIYVCSVPQIDGLYATIDAIILKQERAFMLVGLVYLLYVLFGVNNKLQHNHKKLTRTPQRKLA